MAGVVVAVGAFGGLERRIGHRGRFTNPREVAAAENRISVIRDSQSEQL